MKVGDAYKYRELSTGVIKMLCLPLSNAEVERLFSVTSYLKNWRRSKLSTKVLKPMLYCRFGLQLLDVKISEWVVPKELSSYSPKILYEKPQKAQEN